MPILSPPLRRRAARAVMVWSAIAWAVIASAQPELTSPSPVEISAVTVGDRYIPIRGNHEVNLGASAVNIAFAFGPRTNTQPSPLRIRYRLEGVDSDWRDGDSDMFLTVRFFDASGDQIGQRQFPVSGESAGWNGSLATSPLTHRRETVIVPERATRLWIVISSAGPPSSVGVYVVANLAVFRISSNTPPVGLMDSPFAREVGDQENRIPNGWVRDGNHSSMAAIVTVGRNPTQRAFAVLDDDGNSHAEWHNIMEAAAPVTAGEQILIEWNEAFSIGLGSATSARYESLHEGAYRFSVAAFDIYGNPSGPSQSLAVLVPPPLWRTPWFWGASLAVVVVLGVGTWRYLASRRLQQEMLRLKNERALENERLRIAQDLHDDFGARVTEISIASALAKKKPGFPASASADFDRISTMSRELVAALYETVWAVNPENDNLDALGNFLCQMTNRLCEQAQLPCRLRMVELPPDIQVSSQMRHNVIMAAKEAVHNVVKHAAATELTLHVSFADELLTVAVQDNGRGFNPTERPAGNGLVNMQRRLTDIGGTCVVESQPAAGTKVTMLLPLKSRR